MIRSLFIVCAIAALASVARADTIITGGDIGTQTWTLANSPYTLQGDVTVPSGATLTIEAGVVVQAASGSDSQSAGRDMARVEITVDGSLVVNGTAQSSVTFKSTSTSTGTWYGIVATANATQVKLDHASIHDAVYGVVGESAGTTLQISSTTVATSSQDGLWLRQGAPTLTSVQVIGSGINGVHVTDAAEPTLVRAVIRNTAGVGVLVEHNTAGHSVSLTHCTLDANSSIGVYSRSQGYPATINITSSIVTSSSWGLYNGDGASWSVTYSNIGINAADTYNVTPGAGVISANPLFVSGTDLRLTSNSPSRFGGDNSSDQGALPYDGVSTPGLYGVLWSNTTLLGSVGTYTADGDLTVAPNVTLTIEPGVTLSFTTSSDIMKSGSATNRGELVVRGTLVANGTPPSPITIGSTSPSPSTWYGIALEPGSHDSVLDDVVIRHGAYGVIYRSTATNTLSNLIVDSVSQNAFWLRDGTPTLDHVQVIASGSIGYRITDSASPTFTHCIARNGGASAMFIAHTTAGRSVSVTNCTFNANNGYGVASGSSGYPATIAITGSIITGSAQGVANFDNASWSVTYSNLWNNSSGDYNSVTPGVGTLSSNPLYVSATDLRLTSNSPSRFAAPANADQGALPYDNVQTPGLYGVLWTNTTLTAAGGPYTAMGDLTVGPDTTLIIEPGATLGFAASGDIMQSGASKNRGELNVRGRLIADGTRASPITVVSASAAHNTWYGIILDETAHDSVLDNVIVRHAMYGLVYRSTAIGNTITQFTSEMASQNGVWLRAGSPVIDALFSISSYDHGVRVTDSASPTLTNCVIRNSLGAGIYISHTTASSSLTVTNCTLDANGFGMQSATASAASTIAVRNSIITNAVGYGIDNHSWGTWSVTYSDLWNNAIGNFNVTTGAGTISADPRYVSATDLHLQTTSVAIDKGSSGPANDADGVARPYDGDGVGGAQWDLGAYEYMPPNACGNAVVEGGETCDDGGANGSYGHCDASCSGLGPHCGDGATNGPEQCDDANASNSDACLASCVTASCGDGFVQTGVEQCDDGNLSSADSCLNTCVTPSCGDGFVQAGVEQCDDGNLSNTDGCVNVCKTASCGDGFTQAGFEECDDGNTMAADGCSQSCTVERPADGGGCCDAGRDPSGSLLLAPLVGLLLLQRRRSPSKRERVMRTVSVPVRDTSSRRSA